MTTSCPQPTDAFRDLLRVFASRDGRILEFEILPPAFGPFLEDGDSVGITKKGLVQAFVAARRVFFGSLKSSTGSFGKDASLDTPEQKLHYEDTEKKLAVASEIILLFDCEHLTACNWRKRRLRASFDSDQEALIQALDDELSLMTTYINSPLHRHTKSPTLWQHRQWVQSHFIRLRKPDFQATLDLFWAELSVALRAGELHPRNYYAFTYMRQIHRILSESGGGQSKDWNVRLGQAILGSTADWCLAHPADISGLMFLLYLLDAVPDPALRLSTIGKVISFALDIGWEGESLWTFIGLAIRKFGLLESLGDSPLHPWGVLRSFIPAEKRDGKADISWKAWLARAHAHWSHSSSTKLEAPT